MPSQLAVVSGRHLRPDYVGAINEQATNLPAVYAQRERAAYQDRMIAAEEERLRRETQLARDRLAFERDQAQKGNLIGVGNVGLQYVMNRKAKAAGVNDVINAEGAVKTGTPAGLDSGSGAATTTANAGFFSAAGAGDVGNWVSAAKDWGAWGMSALTGATVGADLGEEYIPFGGKKERRAMGGAAAGAAMGYLATGSPYVAAIAGILGGLGGLL